jgi:glycerate kinase
LISGFELVSDRIELAARIEDADLVITGEGLLDEQSFNGKSVGGVVGLARDLGVPVVVLAGDSVLADDSGLAGDGPVEHRTLVGTFGYERAWADPLGCVRSLAGDVLEAF